MKNCRQLIHSDMSRHRIQGKELLLFLKLYFIDTNLGEGLYLEPLA